MIVRDAPRRDWRPSPVDSLKGLQTFEKCGSDDRKAVGTALVDRIRAGVPVNVKESIIEVDDVDGGIRSLTKGR